MIPAGRTAWYLGDPGGLRVHSDLPADDRVNVVGQVEAPWFLLVDCVRRGGKFVLTRD